MIVTLYCLFVFPLVSLAKVSTFDARGVPRQTFMSQVVTRIASEFAPSSSSPTPSAALPPPPPLPTSVPSSHKTSHKRKRADSDMSLLSLAPPPRKSQSGLSRLSALSDVAVASTLEARSPGEAIRDAAALVGKRCKRIFRKYVTQDSGILHKLYLIILCFFF